MQINPIDQDADLTEFVGADKTTKADPKGKAVKAAPRSAALAEELASPVPAVEPAAVYVKSAGASHPKFSRKAAAERCDEAEAALNSASLEVTTSRNHLTACEHAEAEAHAALIAALPAPTADQVHRKMIAKETAAKLARVAEGKPAVEPKAITARSALDLAAANRPRTSAQSPNPALFSPVSRHTV